MHVPAIRAKRRSPGLAPQHLAGFSALGEKGKPAPRVAGEATAPLLAPPPRRPAPTAHGARQSPYASVHKLPTPHLLTVAGLLEEFGVATVSVTGEEGLPGEVRVDSEGRAGG